MYKRRLRRTDAVLGSSALESLLIGNILTARISYHHCSVSMFQTELRRLAAS
jgi:hypothetical protein